ncbi:MAG: hypothetical protein JWN12_479 [Candidatus Saccharibacteria bacterium]|nr:hypothetical protein [Candidatus Saccharibacteria bacterium]
MSVFPEGSMSGEYLPTFNFHENSVDPHNVVIVNAFGFRENSDGTKIPGPMNEALAAFTDEHFSDRPILVSPDIAPALQTEPRRVLELNSTSGSLDTLKDPKNTGTAGELLQARAFMREENYTTAIIIAHAFHVARVARMAQKLDIVTAIPDGLPKEFDPESAQEWTRSREEWVKRERLTIGYMILRRMM